MKYTLIALVIFFSINSYCQTYKTIIDTTFLASNTNLDNIDIDINSEGQIDVTFQYQNTPGGGGVMKVHI